MIKVLYANKSFLISLFVLSLLIRVILFIGYLGNNQNYWQVDSNTYHVVAKQIADGKGVSTPDGKACFYRLPGYPIFLATYYKIFGADCKNVLWGQVLLAAFIPLLIFMLCLSLFPSNIVLARTAGIYSSAHLGFVLYSGFFMTETLFIFLFLIFAILFLMSVHMFFCQFRVSFDNINEKPKDIPFYFFALPDPIASSEPYLLLFEDMFSSDMEAMASYYGYSNPIHPISPILFCSGLALGLASLVRPVGHYLILLSFLLIIFSNETARLKIRKMLFLSLGWIIPVSLWLIRNYALTGALFFHTLPGGHFLYLSASRVAMETYNCSYQEARDILKSEVEGLIKKEEQIKNRPLNEIEKCKTHEKLALKYFKSRPVTTLKNWVTDMARTTLSLYSAEILYLESGRQEVNYFNKERTVRSIFNRYLFPQTNKLWLKLLIWLETLFYLFILIGLLLGIFKIIIRSIKEWSAENKKILCAWATSACFISLFIVIALSGGYARMRLPAEPFLIILSLSFWVNLIRNK